jgi:FlaA1/EpsC-like NDP-sugar epimerase
MFDYRHPQGPEILLAVNQNIWVVVLACCTFYIVCGVYKNLWEHSGLGAIIRMIAAVFFASFIVYFSLRLRLGYWPNPGQAVMAFYFLITLSLLVRIYKQVLDTVRQYAGRFSKRPVSARYAPVKTLIVGAGESAAAFLINKNQQGTRPREILCIVDKDSKKHGYSIHGVSIVGDDEQIPRLIKSLDIEEIIVAVPTMNNEDLHRIVKMAPINRCKVRLLSGLSADKASDTLREINIEDLLGRPASEPDNKHIAGWVKDKTVLITGGGGSIGSEICRQLLYFDIKKIIIYDISENNVYNLKEELKIGFGQKGIYKIAARIGSIQDEQRLNQVFNEEKPDIVFHAAAYKHVPLMEECPRLAFENNVKGTYITAKCASKHKVSRFVMISTDKAVNPTNVMGATKRLAELLILGMNEGSATEFVCVRFGNVLDSNGSVIPKFKRQIAAGGPVTVTHPEIIRYFMTISEASKLVLEAGSMAAGGEIFILDMGKPVKITELAENLIRMAGLIPHVDIKIEFIGLRPGEKLYEELLLDEEGISKTINDKIFVIKPAPPDNFNNLIDYAKKTAGTDDCRAEIKHFIPEYSYTG